MFGEFLAYGAPEEPSWSGEPIGACWVLTERMLVTIDDDIASCFIILLSRSLVAPGQRAIRRQSSGEKRMCAQIACENP